MIDVGAFIGPYPFRYVPHPDPEALIGVMDREEIDEAWVGHLSAAFHRDPTQSNVELYARLAPHRGRLRPAPAIRPDWPGWERHLRDAHDAGASAIRAYPAQWQLGPHDQRLADLAMAAGSLRLPLLLTVRFEDLRQRSALDSAGDLSAAAIRAVVRSGSDVRVIVCCAGREMIEEVHWGLTLAEQHRVVWDFSWVWGPPEDHLTKLFRTIGSEHFVFGTQWPLRLAQNPRANLDLLAPDVAHRPLADPRILFQ